MKTDNKFDSYFCISWKSGTGVVGHSKHSDLQTAIDNASRLYEESKNGTDGHRCNFVIGDDGKTPTLFSFVDSDGVFLHDKSLFQAGSM